MMKTKWLLGVFIALLLDVPAFAGDDSTLRLALLENGLTENRQETPEGMLAADIPLVSARTGTRVGTAHFEVLEVLPATGPSPFGFVADLVYDFGRGSTIRVDAFTLWCNLVNTEESEPEFPGGFFVIVCTGEGEITGGTRIFRNVRGRLTRRVQLLEATDVEASQSDRGLSLFEFEKGDDDDDDDEDDDD